MSAELSISTSCTILYTSVLLFLHALLSTCEYSLILFRQSLEHKKYTKGLETKGTLTHLRRLCYMIRLSITGCATGIAIIIFPLAASYVKLWMQSITFILYALVVLVVFIIIIALSHWFANMFARQLLLYRSQYLIQEASGCLRLYYTAMNCLLYLFHNLAKWTLHCFGLEITQSLPANGAKSHIRPFVEKSEKIKEASLVPRDFFHNARKMSHLHVSDVVQPRNQVACLDVLASIEKNLEVAKLSSHTRFPLIEGDLDNTVGIVHIKDLFRYQGDLTLLNLKNIAHACVYLKETERLDAVLAKLLRQRIHMALVVDEFGGTTGILPLEHIFEELVGNIQDEFDITEEEDIFVISDNIMRVSGLTPLHDLEEALAIDIESEDASTVGGYITAELRRIPAKGECVNLFGCTITIDDVDERRIIGTTIHRKSSNAQ